MSNHLETLDQDLEEGITITHTAQKDLRQAGGWAMMFAVIGFIISSILLIATIFMLFSGVLSEMDSGPYSFIGGGFIVMFYGIITAVYFLFSWLLLKFSLNAMKVGKVGGSSNEVGNAMSALRKMFMIMGVTTIAMIVVYIVMIIMFGIAFADASARF